MRSGYPWVERSGDLTTVLSAWSEIPLIERVPLAADPGIQFGCSNLGAHLLGTVVSRASGQSHAWLAQAAIFDPLGGRIGCSPVDSPGCNTGFGDVQLTARDMARFGQLYLDHGAFGGRRVLPASPVAASLDASSFDTCGRAILTEVRQLNYGYMWWPGTSGVHRVDFAWGHGGQPIVLVSNPGMAVVATARPRAGFDTAAWQQERAVRELVFHFVASV